MCIPGYWLGGFRSPPPPRKLSYPLGWGTLGCAFPQGLGAALAGRGPALSVSGDGGFLFACGDLATAAQERIPLTAVVVDDGGYGMLRFDQDRRGDPHEGVDLVTPDFAGWPRSFGVRAEAVDGLGAGLTDRRSIAISRWTSPAARGAGRAGPAAECFAALVQGRRQEPITTQMGTVFAQSGRRRPPPLPIYRGPRWASGSSGSASPSASSGWRPTGTGMLPADARPFDTSPVVLDLVPGVRRPGDIRICLAWEGDRLEAALPLMLAPRGARSSAWPTCTRPCTGPSAASPRGGARGGGRRLARAAARSTCRPSRPTTRRSPCSREATAGGRPAPRDRRPARVPDRRHGWDLEAWRAASRPRWGAPLERFRRKMPRDHDAELSMVEPPDDLDAELARGFAVEASGWKGRERHGDPLRRADDRRSTGRWPSASPSAASCACRGSCSTGTGRRSTSACSTDDRLYLLKTGYDERFRRLAPGLVMRLSIIERCFELGIDAHTSCSATRPSGSASSPPASAPRGLPRLRARAQGQRQLHLPRPRPPVAEARLRAPDHVRSTHGLQPEAPDRR